MSQEEARLEEPSGSSPGAEVLHLSQKDLHRLTTYKWRYSLESHGFSPDQAGRLLFMRWLYRQRGVRG
jgi:hypothetical protein